MVKLVSWCVKALNSGSLRGFGLFFILVFIFANCQEGEFFTVDNDIERAKVWFEKNEALLRGRNSIKARTDSSNFFEKYPDWSKSMAHSTSNGMTAVEVGLEYETYLIVSESELSNGSEKPNVINSMVLFEFEPGNYAPYLFKIFPEKPNSSLDNYKFRDLNLTNIPRDFSGSILVFDWEENFIGGWKIVEGEKKFFYGRLSNNSVDPENGRVAATNETNCYMITQNHYSVACVRGYGCGEPVLIDVTVTIVCETSMAPPEDTENPGGGGGDEPGDENCFEPHPFIEGLMVPCEEANITNDITDPCIRQQADKAISDGLVNDISGLIQDAFNINDNVNLILNQVNYLPNNQDAETNATINPGVLIVEISFNENILPSASQEYIMTTVYHEFLHAILFYNGITNDQHGQIASQYISILASALMEHFPQLSMTEAINLAWGGLDESDAWDNLSESERQSIVATNQAHRSGQSGQGCN